MTNKLEILSVHLDWINTGYSFNDILSIYEEVNLVPYDNFGINDIQKYIGSQASRQKENIEFSNFEKITYFVLGKQEFNRDLEFLGKCINIEHLFIDFSPYENWKIENLEPLENCKKLKYINLVFQNISDISPLSELEDIEEIDLLGNPIKTIKPITHFKKLKNVRFSDVDEAEVFELLKNSNNAIVNYFSKENGKSYYAYWLKDWAFIRTYDMNDTTITLIIEPLLIDAFEEKLSTGNTDYISLMKQKIENIALDLLGNNCEMVGNIKYVDENVKFLKGEFDYKVK